jgi:hypothetical protein
MTVGGKSVQDLSQLLLESHFEQPVCQVLMSLPHFALYTYLSASS